MRNIGPWISAILNHLGAHWQAHLVPGVAFFGAMMVVNLVGVVVMMALIITASIVAEIIGGAGGELLVMLAMVAGFFAFLIPLLLIMPLFMGHMRVALLAHRGEAPALNELLWGYRRPVKVMVFMVVLGVLNLVSVMLCFFPSILWAVVSSFAYPAMVDRDLGPVEAIRVSWELARPHFLELLVLMVIYTVVGLFLYYIPIIGPLLLIPMWVGFCVVLYETLRQPDPRTDHA